jgi:hypothetical protein
MGMVFCISCNPASDVPAEQDDAAVVEQDKEVTLERDKEAAPVPERPKRPPLPNPFGFGAPAPEARSNATNLGPAVNSESSEIGPIICPDGNALYFTSDRPGGMGGQDVWVSRRVGGEWQKAENLGPPINTPGDEGPDSFSISEDALYFTACDREYGQGGCDIYVSFKLKGKWSIPENLGPPVNTGHNETNASIASNGDFIIFTSDRPGGLGGTDLWMARRGQMIKKVMPGFSTAGRWEEPVNLGPSVNTDDWEIVGFLMPDNQTLYFSSRGRGGQGADVFRSVLRDGEWSAAENMGDIINTPRDDLYFTLPGSGDLAYFSSDMAGGLGMEDIYSIPIPLLIPKSRLVVVRGSVEDLDTGAPIKAEVKVIDPATDRVIATVESDPKSGGFQVVVQVPRIQLEVKCDEHKAYKETVEVGQDEAMSMVKREIKLSPE